MKTVFFEKIKGFHDEDFGQALSIIPKVDYLKFRNRVVAASIFAGLLFTFSSFTFGPVDNATLADDLPQKKVQRVKVVVNKDGKETKIDTTFNLPDEKMINFKVDSMLKKLDVDGIVSNESGVVIHRGGKAMYLNHPKGANLPGEEQFDIFIQHGDSGKMTHKKKIIRIGEGENFSFGNAEGDLLVPPPPPPPMPPFPIEFRQRFSGDPFAFDPGDAAIISYDKKDIGKGLEKITIIRKKQAGNNPKKEVKVQVDVSDDVKKSIK